MWSILVNLMMTKLLPLPRYPEIFMATSPDPRALTPAGYKQPQTL